MSGASFDARTRKTCGARTAGAQGFYQLNNEGTTPISGICTVPTISSCIRMRSVVPWRRSTTHRRKTKGRLFGGKGGSTPSSASPRC